MDRKAQGTTPSPNADAARAVPRADVERTMSSPLSEFNISLALMSVIPLLLCCYLITVKFFSLSILVGLNASYFLFAVIFSILGIMVGRRAIRRIVQQLVEANLRSERLLAQLTSVNERLRQTNTALAKSHKDLRAAQLHLIQAEKLEAVGQLAAGVAHEVKNPLTAILFGAQYLSKHLAGAQPTDHDELASVAREMEDVVKRADAVVNGLLDFATPQQFHLATDRLNPAIEESLGLVKHELDESRVSVVKALQDDLPLVRMDRNKIQQVFVNLFLNAIQAMSAGGTLTVRTYTRPLSSLDGFVGRRQSDRFKLGETAVVAEVTDTGAGIPEGHMAKLFTPFFTTKQPGNGAGLGLTVTKRIIDLHGGVIEVTNRTEGGVTVTLLFHQHPAGEPQSSAGE
ncbi:MAG: hypothetical protein HYY59_01585 [Candidatus Omnitrophica bacterium]|nr:hypothetical protein [Candidatus Omnitrophota bacterium]